MIRPPHIDVEDGAIPFVLIGVTALGGVLTLAWAGNEWSQLLVNQAGGELTVWVLRGAFWALDLIAAQAAATPTSTDWYTPVLDGPALPIYALAALVMVATLIAETIAGVLTGNTTRIVQAVIRAIFAGMLATVGASLLLLVGGALSDLGRIALDASGAGVDAPLIPLQEVLMDTAEQREAGPELFIAFLAGLVIVFTSLAIYFTLAMRPVLLAAVIVFLPVAHALSVWTPMRRVEIRTWALAFAVLLADAAILTMFAVTNTAISHPEGVDRLIFGTFGLLLAALAPAALARIIGMPELQTAVQSMSRGSRVVAAGAGIAAAKGALLAAATGRSAVGASSGGGRGGATAAGSVLDGPGRGGGGAGDGPSPGGAGGAGARGPGSPAPGAGGPGGGEPAGGAGASAATSGGATSSTLTGFSSPAGSSARGPASSSPPSAQTSTNGGLAAARATSAPAAGAVNGTSSAAAARGSVLADGSSSAPVPSGTQGASGGASSGGGWGSALTRQPRGVGGG